VKLRKLLNELRFELAIEAAVLILRIETSRILARLPAKTTLLFISFSWSSKEISDAEAVDAITIFPALAS